MEPEKLRKLNLRQSNDKPLKIDPDTIENLVPDKILSQWMEGDTEPYFKIQKIDYPIKANGWNYTESFFESFISKMNKAPIPGSKSGHEMSWGKRPPTDILLIGAKIEKKGNGSGSVYLKNYFPKEGESGSNNILIKEAKSNMIEFSLVSYTKDEVIDGSSEQTRQYNVIESMFGERNDIVSYGEGAMEQKTNTHVLDNDNKGAKKVDKKELLIELSTMKENNKISLKEIAEELNLSDQLVTESHKNALETVLNLKKLTGENPLEFVQGLLTEKTANALSVRESKMSELFGVKIDAVTKKENAVREFAEVFLNGKEINDENVKSLKENSIYKKLMGEMADENSSVNELDTQRQNTVKTVDSVRTVKL